MRLGGQFEISCSISEVYASLVDPHKIVACLPDLQRYDVQDKDHFSATIRVGLGRLRGPMSMAVNFVEKRACSYAKVMAKGTLMGSKVNVQSDFSLEDIGSGVTRIKWVGDARLGGRLTYLADGVLEPVIKAVAEKFLRAVEVELGKGPRQTLADPKSE